MIWPLYEQCLRVRLTNVTTDFRVNGSWSGRVRKISFPRRVKEGTGLICREFTFRLLLLHLFYLAVFPELMFSAWMIAALMLQRLSRGVIYRSDCVEWQIVERVTKDEHWQDVAFYL